MKFLDEAKVYVRSGDGGNGCISFRREKFIPKGGPDGAGTRTQNAFLRGDGERKPHLHPGRVALERRVEEALDAYRFPADFPIPLSYEAKDEDGIPGTAEVVMQEDTRREGDLVRVGFAAESRELEKNARDKLQRKGLDLVVANDITAVGSGFGSDQRACRASCAEVGSLNSSRATWTRPLLWPLLLSPD